MRMRAPKASYTVDHLRKMPDDGNRYEIIDGELLMTPAPRVGHQRAIVELVKILGPYADSLGITLLVAPTDVRVSRTSQVEPDLFVLDDSVAIDHRASFVRMRGLVLAIEVLSPSTASIDRGKKRALYLGHGVVEYWIVDIENCAVSVWSQGRSDARTETLVLRWQPSTDHDALTIDLVTMFVKVRRDS
jgi:Uma2 family endonuclease